MKYVNDLSEHHYTRANAFPLINCLKYIYIYIYIEAHENYIYIYIYIYI